MEVYAGNSFNIKRVGDSWTIWRHRGDDTTEGVVLDGEGMEELRDYFVDYYAKDRDGEGS